MTGIAPGRLGIQWRVPAMTWDSATHRAASSRPALRLYRIDTGVPRPSGILQFIDGPEGFRLFDARAGVFVAEIGMIHPDGRFDRIAASDAAAVPAAAESADQSLRIIDLSAPRTPLTPSAPSPAPRFLRLFSRGRHDRAVVRRHAAPDVGIHDSTPTGERPAVTAALAGHPPPALSGTGFQNASGDGWPVAFRTRPQDLQPPDGPAVSRIAS